MTTELPFDPYNPDHVKGYKQLCETGVWPPEHDIIERTESPVWLCIIQSRMATAWVEALGVETMRGDYE